MRQVQTLVQLSDELVALLDRRALREGLSRSSIIRMAVEAYIDVDRLIDEQIVAGYTANPQAPNDPWILHADRRRRDAWAELDW
ncbi:MAG TPA: ribbon-helix-helix protein, CopG family [Acidimicrobiales bacterium]|jgi:hypothetical protein